MVRGLDAYLADIVSDNSSRLTVIRIDILC